MSHGTRWLITGASGQLGSVVVRQLVADGQDVVALSHREPARVAGVTTTPIDVADAAAVREIVKKTAPSVVLHLAAMAKVGEAYEQADCAQRVNVEGTRAVTEAAHAAGARVVFTSTDMVFDGAAAPYDEFAAPRPLSQYGRTKLAAEPIVLGYARGLVVRPALMFGLPALPMPTTFGRQLAALRDGEPLRLFEDEFRTPVWLEDVARILRLLAEREAVGLVHLPGPQRLSRLDMGLAMAEARGYATESIVATRAAELDLPEPRPRDLSLDATRLVSLCPEARSRSTVRDVVNALTEHELATLPGPGKGAS